MENSRKYTRPKFSIGLLIFFVFLLTSTKAFSQNLEFTQNSDFFVGSQCTMSVVIPNISPTRIEYMIPNLPDSIVLAGIEKIADYSVQENGESVKSAKIQLMVKFSKSGTFSFEPITIVIDNTDKFEIGFPEIIVAPNLEELKPELFFEPARNLHALESTDFLLSARYMINVLDYSVELSENALIEETERLYNPQNKEEFSVNVIPIASFECIPFTSGTLTLKNITATLVGYDEHPYTIVLQDIELPVLEASAYAESFNDELILPQTPTVKVKPANEDKNIEFAKKVYDESLAKKKVELPVIIVGFFISVLIIFVAIVLLILRKATNKSLKKFIVLLIFGILLLSVTIFLWYEEKRPCGITYATNMYGIPEMDGQVLTTLESGTKVKIKNDMGDWLLIQRENKATGWILKQDCLIIQ